MSAKLVCTSFPFTFGTSTYAMGIKVPDPRMPQLADVIGVVERSKFFKSHESECRTKDLGLKLQQNGIPLHISGVVGLI